MLQKGSIVLGLAPMPRNGKSRKVNPPREWPVNSYFITPYRTQKLKKRGIYKDENILKYSFI